MSNDDVIEQAARVLAGLETGEDWPTNESLGGGMTGTRDDEFRQEMIDQARDLDAAGLLARPLPDRDEIAKALFVESDRPNAAVMAQAWDAPGEAGKRRWWDYADAVLALLKGRPLPSRDEIADTLYDSLEEGGWISTTGYYPYEVADAVLALLKGTKE